MVVLPGAGEAGATWTARKLLMLLGTISVGGATTATPAARVGIALAASNDTDVEARVRQADAALALARQAGSGFAVCSVDRRT